MRFEISDGTSCLIHSNKWRAHISPCKIVTICFASTAYEKKCPGYLYLIITDRYYYFHFIHEETEAQRS